MVALDGLQVSKATDDQPPLLALSLIHHSVNVLGENFARLHKNGLIAPLELSVNRKRPFDRGGGDNFFNSVVHGWPRKLSTMRDDAGWGQGIRLSA